MASCSAGWFSLTSSRESPSAARTWRHSARWQNKASPVRTRSRQSMRATSSGATESSASALSPLGGDRFLGQDEARGMTHGAQGVDRDSLRSRKRRRPRWALPSMATPWRRVVGDRERGDVCGQGCGQGVAVEVPQQALQGRLAGGAISGKAQSPPAALGLGGPPTRQWRGLSGDWPRAPSRSAPTTAANGETTLAARRGSGTARRRRPDWPGRGRTRRRGRGDDECGRRRLHSGLLCGGGALRHLSSQTSPFLRSPLTHKPYAGRGGVPQDFARDPDRCGRLAVRSAVHLVRFAL